jgi:hypothetical protein
MIDFSELENKVTLLPESAFFLVFCSEAVFLLSKDDEFSEKETKFDACECLNRAMAHLMKMKRPEGRTHPFLAIFEELSSKILNSEKPDTIFLQNFLAEAHDLAEMIEI